MGVLWGGGASVYIFKRGGMFLDRVHPCLPLYLPSGLCPLVFSSCLLRRPFSSPIRFSPLQALPFLLPFPFSFPFSLPCLPFSPSLSPFPLQKLAKRLAKVLPEVIGETANVIRNSGLASSWLARISHKWSTRKVAITHRCNEISNNIVWPNLT